MMSGTAFNDYISQELARFAIRGLITKTAVDPAKLDYLVMGTVIQEGAFRRAREDGSCAWARHGRDLSH